MATATIPTAPNGRPLLGHILSLLRDPLAFLASLPAHGDILQIKIGRVKAVVVCDPGLTNQLLLDDRTFDKGGFFYDNLREVVGNGLATCTHGEHRRQRRLIQPTFHHSRFAHYTQMMTDQITATTTAWSEGQLIDVPAEMEMLTTKVLVRTMFSGRLPADVLQRTAEDFKIVSGGVFRRTVLPRAVNQLPTPVNRRYHRARASLLRTVDSVIREHRSSGRDRGDLLSTLLAAPGLADATEVPRFSEEELRDQLVTFLLAGSETTAVVLAWALHLLACHRDIEQRVQAEVDATLAGGPARFEHVPELRLTHHVITESLRLYPPAWLLSRTATVDTNLGGYAISAGTTIIYSPYLIHRRGDLYANPDHFEPDRWETTDGDLPSSTRDAFVPFGRGARKCIGDRFALTEAVLALATIITHRRLEHLPSQREVGTSMAIGALHPRDLRMRVTRRAAPPMP